MEVYDPSTARKVIDRYRYLGAENGMDPDRCEAICRAIMEESCANEERVSGARQDEAQDEQPEDTPDDNTAGRKAAMEYRNTGIILAAVLIIASAAVSFIGSDDAANAAIKGSWYAVDLQDSYTSGPWKSGYENSFGVNHGGIANRARTNGFGALFRDKGCDLLVCGHKHENCSCIEYEGITYLFALKTGPGCYYEEGMEGGTEISIDGSGASTVRHCFYYDGKGCYYTPQDF